MNDMGISVGPSAHEYARLQDSCRIARAEKKTEQQTKEARIQRRLERKEALDNEIAADNILYGAGIDDSL
ncbi:uncharacterized protein LOC117169176 [Belonocnema kinseyi]|uniref:uncharacterized protein LOC117169176 n=1 Tax=Belonocnema kinseyi TaxID=2817044 RepID=UPI00143D3E32|nr:uncharacterized protein LOC117169176 [Belonocnema kinseyi]